MSKPVIDPELGKFATPKELTYLEAANAAGSMRAAARGLGVSKSTLQEAMRRLQKRAAAQHYAPAHGWTEGLPEGFTTKRVSQHFTKGELDHKWVIAEPSKERQAELFSEMVEVLQEKVQGLAPQVTAPRHGPKDLLTVFPIGDPHFGMQAWAQECGENFDLKEARRLTTAAVDRLIASAPVTETCVIILLGDTFHMDDQRNVTPGHGHQLDVDSRFAKVVGVAIDTYRHVILRALVKYHNVVFRVVRGNHDPHAHLALAYTLSAYFSNEPRVVVDTSPAEHWFYRFGRVLIGATHGDKTGHEKLLGVMAADRAKDWGETTFRYFYTGHVHSQHVREYPGLVCESFRTLAAKDAYAASHGYRAGRDMVCIVHHHAAGEVERHRCDVALLIKP